MRMRSAIGCRILHIMTGIRERLHHGRMRTTSALTWLMICHPQMYSQYGMKDGPKLMGRDLRLAVAGISRTDIQYLIIVHIAEHTCEVSRMVQIDMDMPKRCFDCLIEDYADDYIMRYECSLIYKGYTDKIRMEGRLAECPLREVKKDG